MPMSTLKYPIMKIPGFAFEDTVLSTCATHSQWLTNPTLPAYAWVHAIDSRSGVSTFSASLARPLSAQISIFSILHSLIAR
jgi:hypothetical protein